MKCTLRCKFLMLLAALSFGALPAPAAQEVPVGGMLDGERVDTSYVVGCRRYNVGASQWVSCKVTNDTDYKEVTFYASSNLEKGSAELDGEKGWSFFTGKDQTVMIKGTDYLQFSANFW